MRKRLPRHTPCTIPPTKPRKWSIALSVQAKAAVAGYAEANGMTQVAVLSRLLRWLTSLSPEDQHQVLRRPIEQGFAIAYLRRIVCPLRLSE